MAAREVATKGDGGAAAKSFSALGLNTWITEQCIALGIKVPTPVQSSCIPQILAGRNCIGCAKTGSGKTGAFALPILQKLSEDPFGIFALVLTPTRELAFQIADQFQVLGKPIGVRVVVITGGMDMMKQGLDLTNQPHIVVSTPGRLADHMQSCPTFKLTKIKFLALYICCKGSPIEWSEDVVMQVRSEFQALGAYDKGVVFKGFEVLDEADRLLEDNFGAQLQAVFAVINKNRQTLLFSATMTDELQFLLEDSAVSGQEKPFFYQPPTQIATVELLDQRYVLMPGNVKDAYLVHILSRYMEEHSKSLTMIFTNTCKYAQILKMILDDVGIKSTVLHSQIKQRERLASLAKFKSHNVRILIATDVASRGLDIPMVDLVINHNVPSRAKDYIHRVGRTARAGRGGMALTLVTQFDVNLVHSIEENINTKLVEYEVNEPEIAKILTQVMVARREAEIKLDEQDFGMKKEINKRKKLLLEGKDPEEELKKKRHHKRSKHE